jgi:hypothetical protein
VKPILCLLLVAMLAASTVLTSQASEADRGPNPARGTKPPPVYVGAKGEYIRPAQGSFCYSRLKAGENAAVSLCADYAYPLRVTSRLAVAGRQRLRIDAGRRVKRLRATLVRVEGDGTAFDDITYLRRVRTYRTGYGRFWKARLPAELDGAEALSLDLDFGVRGSSNIWAGIVAGGS